MKKILILFIMVFVLSSIVGANIKINELEINPLIGDGWIELYNPNVSPVDLSNWTIVDNNGAMIIPSGTIINSKDFFTMDSDHLIVSTDQNFTLLDKNNLVIDSSIQVNDTENDNRTWSRVPDGSDVWQFQTGTKDSNNTDLLAPDITKEDKGVGNIIFEDDNVGLNATIEENYLKEVLISGTWINGTWNNFTVFTASANVTQLNFTYIISKDFLSSGQFVEWFYIAKDKSGNVGVGIKQNFTVRTDTRVNITPSVPNGLNGWYKTVPSFGLIRDPLAVASYYRLNAGPLNLYVGPFSIDINATLGGLQKLDFFSDFGTKNESVKNISVKIDVISPEITQNYPTGLVKFNYVNISALIDDKYQGNSGLNLSSLMLVLDGNIIQPNVTSINLLKANFNYSATNLSNGIHTVNVTINDYAGNMGKLNWSFIVNSSIPILNVNSPISGDYDKNSIRLDMDTNIPNTIKFIDNDEKDKILCRSCLAINKTLSFRDGYHNLSFIADGNQINRSIFIDTKAPRINTILPKSNLYINVLEASIRYDEDFLKKIILHYGTDPENLTNNIILMNCSSGRNKLCNVTVDVSAFDNKTLFFSFDVMDKLHNSTSKINKVFVDVTSPEIHFNNNLNGMNISSKNSVRLDLNLSEKVKDLEYKELNSTMMFRKLCSNCILFNRTLIFKKGEHNLILRATDKAGNMDNISADFTVF